MLHYVQTFMLPCKRIIYFSFILWIFMLCCVNLYKSFLWRSEMSFVWTLIVPCNGNYYRSMECFPVNLYYSSCEYLCFICVMLDNVNPHDLKWSGLCTVCFGWASLCLILWMVSNSCAWLCGPSCWIMWILLNLHGWLCGSLFLIMDDWYFIVWVFVGSLCESSA